MMNREYRVNANSAHHAAWIVDKVEIERAFGDSRIQPLKVRREGRAVVLNFDDCNDGYSKDRWAFLNHLFHTDPTR